MKSLLLFHLRESNLTIGFVNFNSSKPQAYPPEAIKTLVCCFRFSVSKHNRYYYIHLRQEGICHNKKVLPCTVFVCIRYFPAHTSRFCYYFFFIIITIFVLYLLVTQKWVIACLRKKEVHKGLTMLS